MHTKSLKLSTYALFKRELIEKCTLIAEEGKSMINKPENPFHTIISQNKF